MGLQAPVQFELILQAKAGMKMVDERFGRVVQRIKPCAVGTLTPKNIVYVALAFSSVGIQAETIWSLAAPNDSSAPERALTFTSFRRS